MNIHGRFGWSGGEYFGSVLLTSLNLPDGGLGMIIKIWLNNFGNLSFSRHYGVFGSSEMRRYLNASAKGWEAVAELSNSVPSWVITAKNIEAFNIQDCISVVWKHPKNTKQTQPIRPTVS